VLRFLRICVGVLRDVTVLDRLVWRLTARRSEARRENTVKWRVIHTDPPRAVRAGRERNGGSAPSASNWQELVSTSHPFAGQQRISLDQLRSQPLVIAPPQDEPAVMKSMRDVLDSRYSSAGRPAQPDVGIPLRAPLSESDRAARCRRRNLPCRTLCVDAPSSPSSRAGSAPVGPPSGRPGWIVIA
jgi:hypothetical protein